MLKKKMLKYFIALVLFNVSLFGQDTTDQEEREKIIEEYKQINSRLMNLQHDALEEIEKLKQDERCSKKIEKAMIEEDSTMENKIKRRDEIISEFEEADKKGDQTKAYNLQQKYEEITQHLMVHQQKA